MKKFSGLGDAIKHFGNKMQSGDVGASQLYGWLKDLRNLKSGKSVVEHWKPQEIAVENGGGEVKDIEPPCPGCAFYFPSSVTTKR